MPKYRVTAEIFDIVEANDEDSANDKAFEDLPSKYSDDLTITSTEQEDPE